MRRHLPVLLAAVFVVFWIWAGIDPVSRRVWFAENIPVVLIFGFLAATYQRFRFSTTAYVFMAAWLFWHTFGSHYTFAQTPFGWVTETFGFERNHFDRVAHFFVGLYAFPLAEYLLRKGLAARALVYLFPLAAIMAVACAYEIIEWWFAAAMGDGAGREFLGSQGDVWDAQKDMLADTLGALFAIGAFALWRRKTADRTA